MILMPEFVYVGVHRSGKRVAGTVDVLDEGQLRMSLRSQGVRPLTVSRVSFLGTGLKTRMDLFLHFGFKGLFKSGKDCSESFFAQRTSTKSILHFTYQLQLLLSSGLSLVQSLELLEKQSSQSKLHSVITSMREYLLQGCTFSEALNIHRCIFPKVYVVLVRLGESTNQLEERLKFLSHYLERTEEMRKKVRKITFSFLMHSLFIAYFFIVLMYFALFKQITFYFLCSLMICSYFLMNYIRSQEGKVFINSLFLKVSFIQVFLRTLGAFYFSKTMQILVGSGLGLIESVSICNETLEYGIFENKIFKETLSRLYSDLESGQTLSTTLSKLKFFPKIASKMIRDKNTLQSLSCAFEKSANFFEIELSSSIQSFQSWLKRLQFTIVGALIAVYYFFHVVRL